MSFTVAAPFCVPTANEWELLLLHILTASVSWNSVHSSRDVRVIKCLYFHFPNDKWWWASFHILIFHPCIFFFFLMRCLFRSFWPLFNFYIVEFYVYFELQSFIKVFYKDFPPQICSSSFCILIVSFREHKFFVLKSPDCKLFLGLYFWCYT